MIPLSLEDTRKLLTTSLIGHIAFSDGLRPYVIPMPFLYLDKAIYLRLPDTGRKHRCFSTNDRVCFELTQMEPDLSDYRSVVIDGRLVPVLDEAEITRFRAASEEKYARLRGTARTGHGRALLPPEKLGLKKILVDGLGARRRGRLQFNEMQGMLDQEAMLLRKLFR